jgi:proteasome assembly chaperone 2
VFLCIISEVVLFVYYSDLQIYYLSSVSDDGSNQDCENLGWKKLDKYDPCQRRWKYLESLAGGASPDDEELMTDEEEFTESDYYASLPVSALFTCLKVHYALRNRINFWLASD